MNEPVSSELGQAAALGSEHACYVLANAYHLGVYGLQKDSSQVAHWAAKMQRAPATASATAECRARIARYVAASQ